MANVFQQANKNLTNSGTLMTQAGRKNSWQNQGTSRLLDASAIASTMSGMGGPNQMQQNAYSNLEGMYGKLTSPEMLGLRSVQGAQGPNMAEQAAGRGFSGIAGPNSLARSMNSFINPYTDNVLNNAINRMRVDEQQTLSRIGSDAAMQGAFGGSRHALLEAEAMDDFNVRENELTSGLLSDMFSQAGQLGSQQQQNQIAANQGLLTLGGNIGQRQLAVGREQLNAGQQFANRNLNTATQMGNLGTDVAAQGINAATAGGNLQLQSGMGLLDAGNQFAQNQMQAGRGLLDLGVTQNNIGNQVNQNQAQQGQVQRSINQAVLDMANNQFDGYVNSPNIALDLAMAMAGGSPLQGNSTQTMTQNPGLLQYMGLGLQAAGLPMFSGMFGGGAAPQGFGPINQQYPGYNVGFI